MQKLGRNVKCPCGSGKKHKHCCYGKDFSWTESPNGKLAQAFPVEGELKDTLDKMGSMFERHFERKPMGDDPIFLGKYLYSDSDMERHTVEAMRNAGVDPGHIYAYQKTGYLLTDLGASRATGAALKAWDDAVHEFDELEHDQSSDDEGKRFDALLHELFEEVDSLVFLFGLANEKFLNTSLIQASSDPSILLSSSQYQAMCVVRAHRTLRSIKTLLQERMAEDVIKLARSIYESYLHIVFVHAFPQKVSDLVDAVAGLRSGTHEYKTLKGDKKDKRIIVDKRTKTEYEGHISAYRMASASAMPEDLEFFDFFYRKTSDLVHPSVFALDGYISEKGLDPTKPHAYEEGVIFSTLVSCMVADRIALIPGCPTQVTGDAMTVSKRIRTLLQKLLGQLAVWQETLGVKSEEVALLRRRCDKLASSTDHGPSPK